MENTVCHFEIPTDDLEAAQRFYTTIFGWSVTPAPQLDREYLFIRTSEQTGAVGGALLKRTDERGMTIYFAVEQIDRTAKMIEEQGGTITLPKTALPKVGWVLTARDPQGNTIGLFQEDATAA
jgi:uncharacterized protein